MDSLTCEACGKFKEGKEKGKHWICIDCNYDPERARIENERKDGILKP